MNPTDTESTERNDTVSHERAGEKLSAYAMGELDEAERAELDALLAEDHELRQQADELSSLSDLLTGALRTQPEVQLTGLQRWRVLWRAWKPLGRPNGVLVMPLTTAAALLALWLVPASDTTPDDSPIVAPAIATQEAEVAEDTVADQDRWVEPSTSPAQRSLSADDARFPERGGQGYKPEAARSPRFSPRVMPSPSEPSPNLGNPYSLYEPAARPSPAPAARRPAPPRLTRKPEKKSSLHRRRGQNYDQFVQAEDVQHSTFSTDVDTASYGRMREAIEKGQLPSTQTRIEELINYFEYDYPRPTGRHPLTVTVDATQAPWARQHGLVRVALRAALPPASNEGSNLVFLVDVSRSMISENKLPLLKRALYTLVDELGARDWVSIVVYAGRSVVLLEPTRASNKHQIIETIRKLTAQGNTAGGSGIELAYELAQEHFIVGGINRVFLATDGDFNVGISDPDELEHFIAEKAQSGVYLSALGFGESANGDTRLDRLAGKGNGNYAYIDSETEARKVLSKQLRSTMHVVAKDVKIQVEFNPQTVESYRLLGYDDRRLSRRDFEDDTKDAGDVGAGHTVTAFYEVSPVVGAPSDELLQVNVRYKPPESTESVLMTQSLQNRFSGFNSASRDFRFGAAVASFGMLLRGYEGAEAISLDKVERWARAAKTGRDAHARAEFVRLVDKLQDTVERDDRRTHDDSARYDDDCSNPTYIDSKGIRRIKPTCM